MDNQFLFTLMMKCLILVICQPIHEWAHAYSAYKLGDDTPLNQGRLTLNPLAHMDLIGTICMLFCGFGWGKPVQVNPLRFNKKISMRGGMAITAAAGPASNLIMAFIFMIIAQCMPYEYTTHVLRMVSEGYVFNFDNSAIVTCMIFGFIIRLNIGLAVFNLIPVPPLDGSKILFFFLKDRHMYWFTANQKYLFIGIFVLISFFSGILNVPITGIMNFLINITSWIHSSIYGV